MDYKEKLEEAKRLYESANADQRYVLESLFPELAESEDERIRKELLEHCINRRDGKQVCVDASDYRRWADWLEKQDPKKHEEELEKAYKTADKVQYRRGYEAATKEMEKQSEQKPVWSEDDELSLYDTKEAIINYWHGQSQEDLLEWLKSLKTRYTWKPSDEQMAALKFVIESLDNMFTAIGYMDNYTKPLLEEILEALKKLREE